MACYTSNVTKVAGTLSILTRMPKPNTELHKW